MPKTWIVSAFVIFLSIMLVREVDQTNHFEIQPDFDPNNKTAFFDGNQFTAPNPIALAPLPPRKVLGDSTSKKVIYVDLTNQRLYAYEGDNLIYNFLVSTGKWGPTPTGTFNIWGKFRFTKMSGGSALLHTYYYLPNVPFVMFFSNSSVAASRGFSLHGTYWHDNFGHPMSHGCVNLKTPEAGLIYNWSNPTIPEGKTSTNANKENPGTEIVIYGTAPRS
jgi:lipoprotein-anchoring transpeptidase ErfK/SrfK